MANQVKNRAPAPIQITAEQLLHEAKGHKLEDLGAAPRQFITDKEELIDYQRNKRKDFENQIRRQRQHIGTWCKYGLWEAEQKEFENARSVFERALDVDYRNEVIWFKYIEMELKYKFINHARNILDRAIALMPRVDKFWFKYTYVEELVGASEQARQVFERWMKWQPDDLAWAAYIKFEERQASIQQQLQQQQHQQHLDLSRVRALFERYCQAHPTSRAYLKYAKWEEAQRQHQNSRQVYERSLEEIHSDEDSTKLLLNFARFEERCHEFERSRMIYQNALGNVAENTDAKNEINQELINFEKRHGSRKEIDDVIINHRRQHYEKLVAQDKYNYDAWFDYAWLEEKEGNVDQVRQVYSRAVKNVPPILEKRFWKRYVYLWINYALYEEITNNDVERTRSIYRDCLLVIPHHLFTFGKIWVYAAQLEIRQKDLAAARKLFGKALGMCAKESLFQQYIDLEYQLGEIDRCRTIYSKFIEVMPYHSAAWKAYAQFEHTIGEVNRARAIYDLAIQQGHSDNNNNNNIEESYGYEMSIQLDMPELMWKDYIEMELSEGNVGKVRELYGKLLERTSHVKVWISFGKFELNEVVQEVTNSSFSSTTSQGAIDVSKALARMRNVFQQANDLFKQRQLKIQRDQQQFHHSQQEQDNSKEDRMLLLESWHEAEVVVAGLGLASQANAVMAMLPKKIKMRRMAASNDNGGSNDELGWEEYYDYIFPDDEKKIGSLKILEKALQWKQLAAASALATTPNEGEPGVESALGKRSFQETDVSTTPAIAKSHNSETIDIDDI